MIVAALDTVSNRSERTHESVSARVRIPPGPESVIVTTTQTGCYMTADVSRVLADGPGMMARWAGVHPDCISSGLAPELIPEPIAAPIPERR